MVLDISPIAFTIGSFSIYWYGILMAVTFVTGFASVRYLALSYGIERNVLEDLMIKLAIVLFVGARLGAVIGSLPYYLENPGEIFSRPGMGSHGAILAVMAVGWFMVNKRRLPYWTLADAGAILFPIGHLFIRIGNFINGELFGTPTTLPWAVQFRTTPVPVHPVQLYEAGFSLLFLPLAWYWAKNPKYPGYAFFRIALIHSVVRLFLDAIRQHSELIGPFVLTQWLALLFIVFSAAMIAYKEKLHSGRQMKA